jgi:hypothetical protein
LSSAIKANTSEAERSIGNLTSSISSLISSRIQQLGEAVKSNSADAERSLTQLATNTTSAIRASAHDASARSTDVDRREQRAQAERRRGRAHAACRQRRSGAHFVGKAEEISTALSQRAAEMTYIVDDKSSGLLARSPTRARNS